MESGIKTACAVRPERLSEVRRYTMTIRDGLRQPFLIMGLLSLSWVMSGCNWPEAREPSGGVGGNATVPEQTHGASPSPTTPGVSGTSNELGPTGRDSTTTSPGGRSSSDATVKTGSKSDVRPGTGTAEGTGSSPSQPNGSAPGSTSAAVPSKSALQSGSSSSGESEHAEGAHGAAGNSGTTGGEGTGSGSSGGTTGKGPAPR